MEEIAAYSEDQWSAKQAERYASKIQRSLRRVLIFPDSGEAFVQLPPLRSVKAGAHRIYYEVREDDTILIVRILDARMQPELHLP